MKNLLFVPLLGLSTIAFGTALILVLHQLVARSTCNIIAAIAIPLFACVFAALYWKGRKK